MGRNKREEEKEEMKPTLIVFLALCLCLWGCGKKTGPKTEVEKPGTVLWDFETGEEVSSSLAIGSDGTVYVGSGDKKVYALKTARIGPAKSPWPMRGQNARHTGRVPK
jgi:hypothetical protein